MAEFQISRNRDAYFVLRGFRYQIDLAILRWLDLQADQLLELERGEDIDLVARSIGEQSTELSRQLQQVKHLETSITLRSPAVLEALANAVEHRTSNPDLNLTFAFFTNSTPGVEKSSPFASARPGIEVWEALRTSTGIDVEAARLIEGVRTVLQGARRPAKLNEQVWVAFQAFVSSANQDQLLSLIRSFQWYNGQPDANELASSVPDRLMALGISPTLDHAAELHARLFLHVMQLIAQPGRKQLRRETLNALTALPGLGDQERGILNFVTTELFRLDESFAALAKTVEQQQIALGAIQEQLQLRVAAEGVAAQVLSQYPIVSTTLPPKVETLCDRQDTVDTLAAGVAARTWTALHGSMGIGKTQLSTLLADAIGRPVAHLSLRDLSPSQAYLQLCAFLTQLGSAHEAARFDELVEAALAQLAPTALIVVDDLPRLDGHDRLSSAMAELTRAIAGRDGRLMTTSYFALPATMLDHLPNGTTANVICPPFSDGEALELFDAYGASHDFRDTGNVQLINLFAQGNAALLAAYARNLAVRDWAWDAADIQLLKTHHHAQDLIDDAVRRLLDTVSDAATRDLLYRLCLILGQFTRREIETVAHVAPIIDHPRERLVSLSGVWIEQRSDGRMTVSPIVKPLSESELAADVRKGVFAALGLALVERRTLSVLEFGEAAHYIEQSENYTRLGLFFLGALSSSGRLPPEQLAHLLLITKPTAMFPVQMDLALRILLRSQQVHIAHQLAWPVTPLLDDMDRLIEGAGKTEQWAVYVASATAIIAAAASDFPRSLRYLGHTLRLHKTVISMVQTSGEELPRISGAEKFSPQFIIWINITGIATTEDLLAWIAFLDGLDEELLRATFAHSTAQMGTIFVVDRPWMREQGKPSEERQWPPILDAYDQVIGFAERRGIESLWAATVRAKIICIAEYLGDLGQALDIAEEAVAHSMCGPRSQFLIRDCIGRQLLLARRNVEASVWLNAALEADFSPFPVIALRSFLEASRAIGDTDPLQAVELARRAVEFGRSQPTEIPEVEMAATLAELGLATALSGDVAGAFMPFDDAAERLLSCRDESDPWKQRFVMFGNTLGFYSSVAARGRPPDHGALGDPYVTPVRGATISPNEACAQFYDQQNYAVTGIGAFCPLLSTYAQAIGNQDRCVDWALRGLDDARANSLLDSLGILGQQVFPMLAARGQVSDAFEIANESLVALARCQALQAAGLPVREPYVSPTDILGNKPSAKWDEIERSVALASALPIVMEIGRVGLSNPEQAAEYGKAVVEMSSLMAATASNRQLWNDVARVVSETFVVPNTEEQLHELASEAAKQGHDIAHMLAYLGCTLVPDATLERAAIYHAIVFQRLFTSLGPRAVPYTVLALPFLCQYWQQMLSSQRFRFANPDWVESQLPEAIAAPPEVRAQRVLSIVLDGLRQRLPASFENVQAWLSGSGDL
jgi:hypothetical protein